MYKKLSTGWLKHLDFMVLDIICLQLAFVMGYFLRHHSFNPYGSPIYRNEAIVFALIQLMIMFFDDSFKNVMKRGYLVEIGMTVKNMVSVIILFLQGKAQGFGKEAAAGAESGIPGGNTGFVGGA